MFKSQRKYPDVTVPTEERLPDEEISVAEITAFQGIIQNLLGTTDALADSWELSQAVQYSNRLYFVPGYGWVDGD